MSRHRQRSTFPTDRPHQVDVDHRIVAALVRLEDSMTLPGASRTSIAHAFLRAFDPLTSVSQIEQALLRELCAPVRPSARQEVA